MLGAKKMLEKISDRFRILHRATAATAMLLIVAAPFAASAQDSADTRRRPPVLFETPLPDMSGKNLVVVELNFPPNTAPPSTADNHPVGHRHPGSVFVYVTEGSVRLALEGEPVEVVPAGGSFFEPPGALHIITENASATEPAKAIAVMIVPDGAALTTRDESAR